MQRTGILCLQIITDSELYSNAIQNIVRHSVFSEDFCRMTKYNLTNLL